jgi:hypothetical protein
MIVKCHHGRRWKAGKEQKNKEGNHDSKALVHRLLDLTVILLLLWGGLCLCGTVAINGPTVQPTDDMSEYGAAME